MTSLKTAVREQAMSVGDAAQKKIVVTIEDSRR